MEVVTIYRFKWGNQYIGILSKKDPIIRTTIFPQHAIHHTEDELDWVCEKLSRHGFEYTYEKLTHIYNPKIKER